MLAAVCAIHRHLVYLVAGSQQIDVAVQPKTRKCVPISKGAVISRSLMVALCHCISQAHHHSNVAMPIPSLCTIAWTLFHIMSLFPSSKRFSDMGGTPRYGNLAYCDRKNEGLFRFRHCLSVQCRAEGSAPPADV